MKRVLVVDDEKLIVKGIRFSLEQDGMEVDAAYDGEEALEMAKSKEYDIILLDVMLPDGNGLKLLEHIRNLGKRENVIIVSARDSLEDKVSGLELGADDYLPKPFHTAELVARVRSVLRRGRTAGELSLKLGNVVLKPESRVVEVGGEPLALLKKEFDILFYFMQRPNHMIDKSMLAEAVWGDYADDSDNFQFVYAQIKNLRRKLTQANASIEIGAVYGFGYKLSEK